MKIYKSKIFNICTKFTFIIKANTNAICKSFDDSPGLRIVKLSGGAVEDEFVGRDGIPDGVDVG